MKASIIIDYNIFIDHFFQLYAEDHIIKYQNGNAIHKSKNENEYPKIIFGKNSWIGGNVFFTKNAFIGVNCMFGRGYLVTKNFPDNLTTCANPAKIIINYGEDLEN